MFNASHFCKFIAILYLNLTISSPSIGLKTIADKYNLQEHVHNMERGGVGPIKKKYGGLIL